MKSSILIVDVDPGRGVLLKNTLEKAGHCCQALEYAERAKKLLEETFFDLLLVEEGLPEKSAVDLIRYTKERYQHVAPVVVSDADDPELMKELLELGIYGYIAKPFNSNLVSVTVENALRHHRLELRELRRVELLEKEVKVQTKSLDEQLFFLQALIDAIPVPIYYKDTNLTYMGCNRSFEKNVNLDRDAIIGKRSADIFSLEQANALEQKDEELLQKGGVQLYETELVNADGFSRAGIIRKATFTNRENVIAGLVGVSLDTTGLQQTEQSPCDTEEKSRFILDNMQFGVVAINPQKEVVHINRQMLQWFPQGNGMADDRWQQIIGELSPPQTGGNFPLKKTLEPQTRESTVTLSTVNGERIFRIFHWPVYDIDDNFSAVIMIFEDITDKQAMELELRQAQKQASIGQLAAGIAHEINTPMQYVGDNLHFFNDAFADLAEVFKKFDRLLQAVKSSDETAEIISDLEESVDRNEMAYLFDEIPKTVVQSLEGVHRVSAFVRSLRDFSPPVSNVKVHVDINRALKSTLTVCSHEWKYVAEVQTDFDPDLPTLPCFPGELNQVFFNIIVNAAHAIGEVTEGGSKGKGVIKVSTGTSGKWMVIRISDSGGGIPEAVRDRIFDPFFTTKKEGIGTGQGLAVTRSIVVDKHNGKIGFETEAGRSTTFTIHLPLH